MEGNDIKKNEANVMKKPVRKLPDDLEDLKFTGNPKEDIKLMNLLIDAWQKVLADEKKY